MLSNMVMISILNEKTSFHIIGCQSQPGINSDTLHVTCVCTWVIQSIIHPFIYFTKRTEPFVSFETAHHSSPGWLVTPYVAHDGLKFTVNFFALAIHMLELHASANHCMLLGLGGSKSVWLSRDCPLCKERLASTTKLLVLNLLVTTPLGWSNDSFTGDI